MGKSHAPVPATAWILRDGAPAPSRDGRFGLAAILNVTPDSFYDGGRLADASDAVAKGRALLADGADMLDIGGESTRPGADPVPAEVELARVLPVVRGLSSDPVASPSMSPGISPVISIDTTKAAVAAACLGAGVQAVNDVSAALADPGMADVLAQYRPGYVLMHAQGDPRNLPRTMQTSPRYDDVLSEVLAFFESRMTALVKAGLPENRIALDPGIGFGKTLEHNLALLANIEALAALGRPIYLGLSNKSLWGKLLGLELQERGPATQAATALMAARGAAIHRVHDAAAARHALTIVAALTPHSEARP